ncbi:MAG: shikimate dehydrogenase [Candidatus Polarisedimenticolia bacterium]
MPPRPLVIESLACRTVEDLRRAYLAADPRSDVVELRLDLLRDLRSASSLDRLLDLKGKPKLVTVRSRPQGGSASPSDREPLLKRALRAGVEYLDVEFEGADAPLLHAHPRTRRILSHHDLLETPADLPERRDRMRAAAPGALLKIVTLADAASDNVRIRDLLRGSEPGTLAAFCMGPKGIASRVLACAWSSAAVFAPRRGAPPTAPGQIPLEDLFEVYRFDRLTPKTRLLGVLGFPVAHSLSPLLHNAALGAAGRDDCYLPFEAESLVEFLPLWSDLRLAGLSVTLPHKETILAHLDVVDEVARVVGAVNTVVKRWNQLWGFNTDVEAAIAPLRPLLSLQGARVAVLGAGGAARAVVHGLLKEGAKVTVFNRTAERARALARALGARHLPWDRLRRLRCDLLVNATPVGMTPGIERTPIPAAWILAPVVYDLIYNPGETRLLREARERGAVTLGGIPMFVGQAAAQFRLFTGEEPPLPLLERTVLAALGAATRPVAVRPRSRRPARVD